MTFLNCICLSTSSKLLLSSVAFKSHTFLTCIRFFEAKENTPTFLAIALSKALGEKILVIKKVEATSTRSAKPDTSEISVMKLYTVRLFTDLSEESSIFKDMNRSSVLVNLVCEKVPLDRYSTIFWPLSSLKGFVNMLS